MFIIIRAVRVLTITAVTADIRRNEERSCILWRFLEKGLGFRPRFDKFTLEEAIPCAQMAVDCGVDWVEVGTPLIYGEGLESIVN